MRPGVARENQRDEQDAVGVSADAEVGDCSERHLVDKGGECHALGAERFACRVDAFDLLEEFIFAGGRGIGL